MYRQIHSHTLLGHATGVRRFREMMASSTSGEGGHVTRNREKHVKHAKNTGFPTENLCHGVHDWNITDLPAGSRLLDVEIAQM